MAATVIIWVSTILLGTLAIGFFLSFVLMTYAMLCERKDREMVMIYCTLILFSAGCCTGLIFAAIAVGKNLL